MASWRPHSLYELHCLLARVNERERSDIFRNKVRYVCQFLSFIGSLFSEDRCVHMIIGAMHIREAQDISWCITRDYGLCVHHVDTSGISSD